MICLDELPTIEKFCGCFPLKFGCYVIALFTIIATTTVPSVFHKVPMCYERNALIAIIMFGSLAIYLYSIVISIYFICGLCRANSTHPTLTFIFLLIKSMLFTIMAAIFLLIETPKEDVEDCPDGFVLGAATTFDIFIHCFFLLIVNSYRIEDEDIFVEPEKCEDDHNTQTNNTIITR